MLDLLVIGLLQAALGEPATQETPPAPPSAEATPAPAPTTPPAPRLRCREEAVTGTRVRTRRVCEPINPDDQEVRDTMRQHQERSTLRTDTGERN